MTWPTVAVNTTNVDAGTDSPATFRADALDAFQKLNQMIAHFTSAGGRIIGDFSNATITNRLAFQTSTLNSAAQVPILPNGTGGASGVIPFNNSDPTNAAYLLLGARSADVTLTSGITGTGTYLPMTFYTGGSLKATLDNFGNFDLAVGSFVGDGSNLTGMAVNFSVGGWLTTTSVANGYGVGSGGNVTQITSKSTAVTLNKPTGFITMNNASLAAGASVKFTVNNSVATSADVVLLTPQTYGASYRVETASSGGGSFDIRVTNITAGALTDPVGINFVVFKGSAT